MRVPPFSSVPFFLLSREGGAKFLLSTQLVDAGTLRDLNQVLRMRQKGAVPRLGDALRRQGRSAQVGPDASPIPASGSSRGSRTETRRRCSAPVRGPVALAAERAAASGAANAGASNQAANRFDPVHTAVKPPSAKKMPDPASIPGVKLLGTIDLPVTLASGSTPLSLNTRLQRSGCPFGVRWLDVSTKDSFTMERTEQAKKHFNWYNFFTSNGGKPRYMKLRPFSARRARREVQRSRSGFLSSTALAKSPPSTLPLRSTATHR